MFAMADEGEDAGGEDPRMAARKLKAHEDERAMMSAAERKKEDAKVAAKQGWAGVKRLSAVTGKAALAIKSIAWTEDDMPEVIPPGGRRKNGPTAVK